MKPFSFIRSHTTKGKEQTISSRNITDADDVDDQVLLANTPAQLESLELAARGISL